MSASGENANVTLPRTGWAKFCGVSFNFPWNLQVRGDPIWISAFIKKKVQIEVEI